MGLRLFTIHNIIEAATIKYRIYGKLRSFYIVKENQVSTNLYKLSQSVMYSSSLALSSDSKQM